jgi:hypothetical protein
MDRASWLPAFMMTIAVEVPLYSWGLRRVFGGWPALALALGLNLLTHPIAWSVLMHKPGMFPGLFVVVEVSVTLVEAVALALASRSRWARRSLRFREACVLSFTANAASAGLGLFF